MRFGQRGQAGPVSGGLFEHRERVGAGAKLPCPARVVDPAIPTTTPLNHQHHATDQRDDPALGQQPLRSRLRYQEPASPGRRFEELVVIHHNRSGGRVDDLNHLAGGTYGAQEDKMTLTRRVDIGDRGLPQRQLPPVESDALEPQPESRCRALQL